MEDISPTISLIVAMAKGSRVIGLDGDMPWKLRRDLQNFKRLTTGHPIIMGRKTYESIGRPLPNRKNIVMTRNPEFEAEGCSVVNSLDRALLEAVFPFGEPPTTGEVFVIGGEAVYKEALPIADKLYITLVDYDGEGDAFFPEYRTADFKPDGSVALVFDADEKNSHATEFWVFKRVPKL